MQCLCFFGSSRSRSEQPRLAGSGRKSKIGIRVPDHGSRLRRFVHVRPARRAVEVSGEERLDFAGPVVSDLMKASKAIDLVRRRFSEQQSRLG